MKKLLSALFIVGLTLPLSAEAVRLKSGVIINGSITGQTKNVLNLTTAYGELTISQREIVEISPDKHKITLKGGGEIIGIIEDINEFNVRIKTDDGAINVDVPRVAAIEIYDYGAAEEQRAYAEQKQREAEEALLPKAPPPGTLVFDDGLEQAFAGKNPALEDMPVERIVRRNAAGEVISDIGAPQPAAVAPAQAAPAMPAANITKTPSGLKVYTGALPDDAKFNGGIGTAREKNLKGAVTSNIVEGKNARRYFALEIGAMQQDLTFKRENAQGHGYDVGGVSARINVKHYWRMGGGNLWLGPELGLSQLAKSSFVENGVDTDTSGYAADLGLGANYFFVEGVKYRPYISASAGYQIFKMDFKYPKAELKNTADVSSNGFVGGIGLGIERKVADLNLGIEAKAYFAPRSGELKESSSMFYSLALKASWRL